MKKQHGMKSFHGMNRQNTARLLGAVLSASLLLCGCGFGDDEVQEAVDRVKNKLEAATEPIDEAKEPETPGYDSHYDGYESDIKSPLFCDVSSPEREPIPQKQNEEDTLFLDSLREIASHGSYTLSFSEELQPDAECINGTYSDLNFYFDETSLKEYNDFYEIRSIFHAAYTVPREMKIGEELTLSEEETTGERFAIKKTGEDTYVDLDTGMEYYTHFSSEGDDFVLYQDSDDRVEYSCFYGIIRVRKDALVGQAVVQNYHTISREDLSKEYQWYNAVSFDPNGYATRLIFLGD